MKDAITVTEYKRAVEYVDWLNKKDGVVVIPGLSKCAVKPRPSGLGI